MLVPEQDAGINYALTREAKEAAEKYNNSVKRITAFTKRRQALAKAKAKVSGQDTASLEDKIEEFEHSLNIAETEKAKAVARLDLLREGGLPVDEYMEAERPGGGAGGVAADWEAEQEAEQDSEHQVTEVNYYSYEPQQPVNTEAMWGGQEEADPWGGAEPDPPAAPAAAAEYTGEVAEAVALYTFAASSHDELSVAEGEWVELLVAACEEEGWVMARSLQTRATGLIPASFVNQISRAEHEAAQQQTEAAPEAADPWVDSAPAPASTQPPAAAAAASVSGKYQVLYDFTASAEDELTIAAGDLVLVTRPGEDEGWLHGALGGREGIFPSSYVEPWTEAAASAADDSWAAPFPAPASGPAADLAIPSCPPPMETEDEDSSSEADTDESDDDEAPPGLAPPPGPPPAMAPPPGPPPSLAPAGPPRPPPAPAPASTPGEGGEDGEEDERIGDVDDNSSAASSSSEDDDEKGQPEASKPEDKPEEEHESKTEDATISKEDNDKAEEGHKSVLSKTEAETENNTTAEKSEDVAEKKEGETVEGKSVEEVKKSGEAEDNKHKKIENPKSKADSSDDSSSATESESEAEEDGDLR